MYPGNYAVCYEEDMAITRTKTQWLLLAVALLLVFLVVPLLASSYWLTFFSLIGLTVIAVLGLHFILGCCGLISLGHAAFVGIGAYTAGILANNSGLPFWVSLPCAGIASGTVGIVFGIPSIRIKGFYLAMATFAAQFLIMWGIRHAGDITGGQVGLSVPYATLGGMTFDTAQSLYLLIIGMTALMVFAGLNLTRTKVGRAFIAIRDNENAASVMGISPFRYKLLAFFIGCFFAGIAGALWAYYLTYITPDLFSMKESVWYLGMIIVGGMGSTLGAVLGAMFVKGLDLAVDLLSPMLEGAFPSLAGVLGSSLGLVLFALSIMLFLIFDPRGLAHRWHVIKNSYRIWPYSY